MLTRRGGAISIRPSAVFAAVMALGPVACVTRTVTPAAPRRPARAATFEEVAAAYDGFSRHLSSLSAKGDLEVRDLRAGKARRLSVRVLAGRGGRLYVKASVAVVTALEVVADGERFWFRVPSKKTVWTGLAAAMVDESVESDRAPYYALRPADLVEALLPEPLAVGGPPEVTLLEGDQDAFALTEARLEGGRGLVRRRVLLDREALRPLAIRTYDREGTLLREAAYADWREGLARRVKVSRPREGYEVELILDEMVANAALPERAFKERPAEGYAVVEVGKR